MKKKFKIYTTEHCGYCTRAKELLDNLEYTYEEVNLNSLHDRRDFKIRTGHKTVPQIYIEKDGNFEHIGGYTELAELFPQ